MQKTRNEFRKECEKIILSNKDDATKINELNYKIEEILDRKFCEIVKLLRQLEKETNEELSSTELYVMIKKFL